MGINTRERDVEGQEANSLGGSVNRTFALKGARVCVCVRARVRACLLICIEKKKWLTKVGVCSVFHEVMWPLPSDIPLYTSNQ